MNIDTSQGCIVFAALLLGYAYLHWAFKCDCNALRRNWSTVKPLLLSILCLWAVSILGVVSFFIAVRQ